MANNDAHDTRTTVPAERDAQAVSLNVAARAAVVAGPNWPAEVDGTVVAADGFESGDMIAPQNSVGLSYYVPPEIYIATMDPDPLLIYKGQTGSVSLRPADLTKDFTALTGDNNLRFLYIPGNAAANANELEFFTNAPGMEVFWMGFDLRVPVNFDHAPMANGLSGHNNKLFRIYTSPSTGNTDTGSFVGMEFRRTSNDAANTGNSYWYCKISSANTSENNTDLNTNPRNRFITIPQDRGKWMRIAVKITTATTNESLDGSMEVWRKWEGEADFTKEFDFQNRGITRSAETGNGFMSGYLLGYANSPYAEDTEFFIDNFEMAGLT